MGPDVFETTPGGERERERGVWDGMEGGGMGIRAWEW